LFLLGNNVLCYDALVLYPGKCIKWRKTSEHIIEYLIQYMDGDSKWHKWVYNSKLLEVNKRNLEKMAFNQRIW